MVEYLDARSLQRFQNKLAAGESGCWEWVASAYPAGYGSFWLRGKLRRAHRVAYSHWVGPIPDGYTIDHLCRNRLCVNPKHLEPVTNRENILRGIGPTANNARKTHCAHGHPFAGSNLVVSGDGQERRCRECVRLDSAKRRAICRRLDR